MVRGRRCVWVAALAVCVIGCGSPAEPRSTISSSNGLRTFSVIREIDGNPVTCGMPNEPSPVRGVLAGDPADPREAVWLANGDRRLSVVWPDDFTVKFEPGAVLYNDTGRAVGHAGELIELTQVPTDSATGTFENPYVASCLVFGEVYVYRP